MPGQIDIVLPGLFHLPLHELDAASLARDLPHLNSVLRLASAYPNRCFSIDAILRRVLQMDGNPLAGLPVARAWADGSDADERRLQLCQAVHLRADLHQALVVPIPASDDNIEDISKLIKDLEDIFKVDCDISAVAGGHYLMRLRDIDAPTHHPHPLSVLGKPANPYIEQSRSNLPWYRLINEMQMFLHQHPLNAQRLERGLLPVNSLWCWGGGHRQRAGRDALTWYCEDLPLNRFAASLDQRPASLGDLGGDASGADAVIVDLRLLEALKTGAVDSLDRVLGEIDQQVFGPALAVARTRRKTLWLRCGYDFDYRLAPADGLRFWRRARSLTDWAARDDSM